MVVEELHVPRTELDGNGDSFRDGVESFEGVALGLRQPGNTGQRLRLSDMNPIGTGVEDVVPDTQKRQARPPVTVFRMRKLQRHVKRLREHPKLVGMLLPHDVVDRDRACDLANPARAGRPHAEKPDDVLQVAMERQLTARAEAEFLSALQTIPSTRQSSRHRETGAPFPLWTTAHMSNPDASRLLHRLADTPADRHERPCDPVLAEPSDRHAAKHPETGSGAQSMHSPRDFRLEKRQRGQTPSEPSTAPEPSAAVAAIISSTSPSDSRCSQSSERRISSRAHPAGSFAAGNGRHRCAQGRSPRASAISL